MSTMTYWVRSGFTWCVCVTLNMLLCWCVANLEDMKEECGKFGTVEGIQMPREGDGKTMVFIKFDSTASAEKAFAGLHGRSFENRKVVASYYDVSTFDAGIFN
jgi:hypothetical protein